MQLFYLGNKDILEVQEGLEGRALVLQLIEITLNRWDLKRLLIERMLFNYDIPGLFVLVLLNIILMLQLVQVV